MKQSFSKAELYQQQTLWALLNYKDKSYSIHVKEFSKSKPKKEEGKSFNDLFEGWVLLGDLAKTVSASSAFDKKGYLYLKSNEIGGFIESKHKKSPNGPLVYFERIKGNNKWKKWLIVHTESKETRLLGGNSIFIFKRILTQKEIF